jgi:protein-S-isoprenylcysteine O-methyltransferase Ste14
MRHVAGEINAASLVTWACWGAFGLAWLAGAVYNWRRAPAARERTSAVWAWLLGGAGAWLIFRAAPGAAWGRLTVDSPWVWAAGLPILVASTAFVLWARVVLGTMWSSTAVARDGHALRTGGPYAVTRHPIYTGLLGMFLGTALVNGLGPWGPALLLGLVVLEVKIHAEERLLSRVFPHEYEQYRRLVPRLVPSPLRLGRLRSG